MDHHISANGGLVSYELVELGRQDGGMGCWEEHGGHMLVYLHFGVCHIVCERADERAGGVQQQQQQPDTVQSSEFTLSMFLNV